MEAMAYSNLRKNLAKSMEQVCDEHEPLIITRKNSSSVVMVSLEDYNAMAETMYLLQNPANAERLMASIREFEQGKFQQQELVDDDCVD
ncbi:MAG TPA: type II toxin-antitoxin system prevent-host-death family antitoxin [Desulfobacterales bacterium]|nr:type II toxin-antitoxin system prevent-host-death family antitoxin [Desulfobacterales bacterium]